MKTRSDSSEFDAHATGLSRRSFLTGVAALTLHGIVRPVLAETGQSDVDILQLIYPGGNWQPRPSAVRRLAWEVHKRTSVSMVLEPATGKPQLPLLSHKPIAYLSGDRPFPPFVSDWIDSLRQYIRYGGMILVDPAWTPDGDPSGFLRSVDTLFKTVLPEISAQTISADHVLFRSFYQLSEASGRRKGSPGLTAYTQDDRVAVVVGDHDMGGAWARDNLGNWEHDVEPGGSRQRENAFRLGINLVMYALCGDYKNETPHTRFSSPVRIGN